MRIWSRLVAIILAVALVATTFVPIGFGFTDGNLLSISMRDVGADSPPAPHTESPMRLDDYTVVGNSSTPQGVGIQDATPYRTMATLERQTTAYRYKDYGANHFDGDFEEWFDVRLEGSVRYGTHGYAATSFACLWMLANGVDDYSSLSDFLAVYLSGNTLYLVERVSDVDEVSDGFTLGRGQIVYLHIERDESIGTHGKLSLHIYQEQARHVHLATLEVTLRSKADFRYHYVMNSLGGTGTEKLTCWSGNYYRSRPPKLFRIVNHLEVTHQDFVTTPPDIPRTLCKGAAASDTLLLGAPDTRKAFSATNITGSQADWALRSETAGGYTVWDETNQCWWVFQRDDGTLNAYELALNWTVTKRGDGTANDGRWATPYEHIEGGKVLLITEMEIGGGAYDHTLEFFTFDTSTYVFSSMTRIGSAGNITDFSPLEGSLWRRPSDNALICIARWTNRHNSPNHGYPESDDFKTYWVSTDDGATWAGPYWPGGDTGEAINKNTAYIHPKRHGDYLYLEGGNRRCDTGANPEPSGANNYYFGFVARADAEDGALMEEQLLTIDHVTAATGARTTGNGELVIRELADGSLVLHVTNVDWHSAAPSYQITNFFQVQQGEPAWLEGSGPWKHRIRLTADNTKVDENLEHFPLTVFLNSDNGETTKVFDEVAGNYSKIAIADVHQTQYYIEVEEWNYTGTSSNSTAILHFGAANTTLSYFAATDFYLYYDSTKADNTDFVGVTQSTPAKNVWNTNFKFRTDSKDKTISSIEDSTSNAYHGTKKDDNEPVQADGKVGKAQDYDGTDDYISLGDVLSFERTDSFSVSVLVKRDSVDDYHGLIGKMDDASPHRGWALYFHGADNKLYWVLRTHSTDKKLIGVKTDTAFATTGVWIDATATYDGSSTAAGLKIYINGSPAATSVVADALDGTIVTTTHARLGRFLATSYDGLIDEARVASTEWNAAWIKATYNSLNDSLLTYGSEEAYTMAITSTPDSYDFGTLEVNTTAVTGLDYFTITNTGGVAVDITIQGTDLEGGTATWTLNDAATPGENTCGLKAGLEGGDYTVIVKKSATYNTLKSNLAVSATQKWGMKIWMPTSVTDYDGQTMTGTVTLVASAAS